MNTIFQRSFGAAFVAGLSFLAPSGALAFPFSSPQLAWSGSPAEDSIYVGDVNGDALPDVALHGSNTTLNWFVNTGGGNFAGSHVISVAGFRVDFAQVADLDQDGDADLVVVLDDNTAYNKEELAVFRNTGSGFTKTQQFALPGYMSYEGAPVVATDVDNDGDLDIALSVSGASNASDGGKLIVCLNNGSGTLAAPVTIDAETPEYPNGMVAGDFNNDGKTDLCVSHSQSHSNGTGDAAIHLYSGLGSGNFGAALKLLVPLGTTGYLETGDLNRDGRLDLLFAHDRSPAAAMWRANTGGSFSAQANLYSQTGLENSIGRAVSADLDEDGDPDLVWGRYNQTTGTDILWSRGNGAGQFEAPAVLQSTSGNMVRMIAPMDTDLDGDLDLVMLTADGLVVSLNKAIHRKIEPAFTTVNAAAVLTGEARLASADFDRDGDEDLLVLSPDDGTLRWLPANGSSFGSPVTISTAATGATAMATGDVTGDGLPDIVIGMPALGQLHLLRNVGNGASWQTQLMPNLASVQAVQIADVDIDGALDVVASSMSTYHTILFRNINRNATAWTQEQVSTSINAVDQIQTVQFKRPGRPEILLTSYDPEVGMCQVRQLTWSNNVWSALVLAQGNAASSVTTAADLNGDLTNDFVRSLGYGAGWQPNYNNGTFNPAQSIPGMPEGLRCGRLTDLNGDGKPDLVAAGFGSVVCALNEGSGIFAAPYTLFSSPGAVFRDVVVFDFERDGDPDLAVADAATDQVRVLVNRRGQFDTVSTRENNGAKFMAGEEKTMIRTTVEHLGAPGDDSMTVSNFRIRLNATTVNANGTFTLGAPLTASEATGLLERVAIYRDLGAAGTFDSLSDPLIASVTNFAAISNGYLTVPVSSQTCTPGQTMSYYFRVKMRSPLTTPLNAFNLKVLFEAGGSAVVHAGIAPDFLLRDRGASGSFESTAVVFKPTQLQQWRYGYWNTWDSTGMAANGADPDGDGLTNLVEYGLGQSPVSRDNTQIIEVFPFNNQSYVRLRVNRYPDPKVKLTVETTTNLQTWTPLSSRTGYNAWVGVQPIVIDQGTQSEVMFISGNQNRVLARLTVEELP